MAQQSPAVQRLDTVSTLAAVAVESNIEDSGILRNILSLTVYIIVDALNEMNQGVPHE